MRVRWEIGLVLVLGYGVVTGRDVAGAQKLVVQQDGVGSVGGRGAWQMEQSGTTADLRGIHAVGSGVAWASGTHGTVLRTEDAGFVWQGCAMPPGAENLDFRAVWAWDANTAVVMSSGTGDLSRLYQTKDGCAHWTLLYTNPDKDGFWDGLSGSNDPKQLTLLGDPTGGSFTVLRSADGACTGRG
jgi:photosystem II stability/assembly factor-like uncharacterized protein